MEKRKITAREAAIRSLSSLYRDKKYSNLEIDASIKKFGLEGVEKGLYTTLVYGVVERRLTLDYIISLLSARPISELEPLVITLLHVGLYQIIYLDKIPDSAAVNETVNMTKKYAPRAGAFVNALLRGFLRKYDKKGLPYPDKSNLENYLSVRYSCSRDVVELISRSVSDAEAVLQAFDRIPNVTLRVNTLKASREEILSLLEKAGISASVTKISPFGIRLSDKKLPAYVIELINDGVLFIQDEASQIATAAAAPRPGDVVIDACACPGGKSFGAAMLMENCGDIMSFDLHKSKLSLITGGANKLGITIIKAAVKDGARFDSALSSKADLLICDVPCSGLGVISKKPEIRYKTAAEMERLPDVQCGILQNCAEYVKAGGVLCYSTCTINSMENEGVIKRFLSKNHSFALEDFTVGELESCGGMVTLLPNIHNTDGFFIARLRRK